jgi:hypothetical protein
VGEADCLLILENSLNYSIWSDIPDTKKSLPISPGTYKTTYFGKAEGCGTTHSDIRSVTVFNEVRLTSTVTVDVLLEMLFCLIIIRKRDSYW